MTRTRVAATGVKGVVEDKMRYYMTGGTVAVAFASIAAIVGGFFKRKRARKGGRK